MSDGKPTYGVSGNERNSTSKTVICGNSTDNNTIGDGSSTTHTIHTQVEEQVNRIIHNGITPYAVFVGSDTINCRERDCSLNTQWGTSCSKWLADIGFTTFSAKESGDLEEIFENISHLIQIQARAWILTDPMGDNIDFIQFNRATNMEDEFLEENGVVSWYLRKAEPVKTVDGNTTTYTYTLSYRIRLDNLADGVQAEQYYPTNGVTSLTYLITTIRDGEESYKDGTAYFNIPSVKGFEGEEITLNKVGSFGEAMSGVTFTLTTADDPSFSKTFTTDANGALKLSGIPSGHTYTLTETVPNGYEAADPITVTVAWGKTAVSGVSNNTIVNQSKTTSITVTKAWDDGDDQDGIRPGSVEVQLYADGTACGDPVTVTASDNWQYTWTNLPEYKAGKPIVYTVKEVSVPTGYTSQVNGFTITNTHVPETTSVTVTKAWDDGDDQDGLRPDYVTVQLYADGTAHGDPVEVKAADGWTYTWTNLPKNEKGEAIVYTVEEVNVPTGYTSDKDGFTITNSHTPATTELTITKEWVDGNDQDGIRPESVQVQLYADGTAYGDPITVTAADGWRYTVQNLPKYKDGVEIQYTINEVNVPDGYQSSVDGTTITNTHETKTVDITVTKAWEDGGDQDGIRPESVEVQLYADGEAYGDPVTVTEANNWQYTWEDLPEYKDGKAVVYTVKETTEINGYTSNVDGFTITNTHVPETTSVTVTKVWEDGDNQDGIRPESVEVQLYANGEAYGDPVEVTADNGWQYTWTNLPKNEKGEAIVYTVAETSVPAGYTSQVDGLTITNTHETATTSVTVTKAWDDGDNQDGIRPESVEVQLYANGEAYGDPVEVTADNGWQYTWMNLPENANGEAIVYTVAEINVPEGYEAQVDGLTITNTHTPGTTEFTVTKEWVDGNDQDGSRPDHVTVQLYAGEKAVGSPVEITAEMDWTYTWTDLDVNAAGQKIEYTVKELNVPEGYEVSYAPAESGNADYIVTNTHIPTISIPITKTVEQKGSEAPAKEIFEFIISELNSDAEYTIENASIETDGAGTYTGTLTITVPDAEAFAKLSEGFTVTEKNSGEENWSYDTTEWFVWMTMNEDGSISIHTANLTAGEKPWDNAASASSALTFTNTYNKTQTPVIPEAPDTGDSNGVGWMAILFATSAVCLGAVALYNKKRIHRN